MNYWISQSSKRQKFSLGKFVSIELLLLLAVAVGLVFILILVSVLVFPPKEWLWKASIISYIFKMCWRGNKDPILFCSVLLDTEHSIPRLSDLVNQEGKKKDITSPCLLCTETNLIFLVFLCLKAGLVGLCKYCTYSVQSLISINLSQKIDAAWHIHLRWRYFFPNHHYSVTFSRTAGIASLQSVCAWMSIAGAASV